MSTRATIHFCESRTSKPTAIIYRHSDGYPDGLGKDLQEFIREVKSNVPDNRFTDPAYLAAKWVVWDAAQMVKAHESNHPLNFLSVGIVDDDPDDIEYKYNVICDGNPTIEAFTKLGKEVEIPTA